MAIDHRDLYTVVLQIEAPTASTGFAPFELKLRLHAKHDMGHTYGIRPSRAFASLRSTRGDPEMGHGVLIESRVHETHFANWHRQEVPDFEVGN